MSQKKKCCKVESELQCKATAALDAEVVDEIMAEDKSLADILAASEEDSDEKPSE